MLRYVAQDIIWRYLTEFISQGQNRGVMGTLLMVMRSHICACSRQFFSKSAGVTDENMGGIVLINGLNRSPRMHCVPGNNTITGVALTASRS